jgi:GNAT superfamily N-acetyltransferase
VLTQRDIREAVPADVGDLLRLIQELARFEQAPDAVEATEADLQLALFGPDPKVFALVAEGAGAIVGMAIYFVSFSTWTGRHGLYLEDLFVAAEHRAGGVGRALMAALARRAIHLGCRRLEWAVLDWNEQAIGFYRSLGAVPMDEWTTFRLSGPALVECAAS